MTHRDPFHATTITELMRWRAALTPDRQYFNVYGETVTYRRLWEQSGRYAAGLARGGVKAGDRVCLIYPTCAEFFYTFLGALRIGAVPVPLYPTLGVEGTANIFRNAEATTVATIGWFRTGVDASVALAPNIQHVLEPPDLDVDADAAPLVEPTRDDLAFIQYTSGSTGHPRGVMLTHANVIDTVKFMAEGAALTSEDRVVSWLPLYHDMGLIGCSFTPPLTASPLWLLPPDLRNPRQWLETITSVRGTFTVSPDFGYRNCVRHVRDTSDLDLTTLKGALSGAEPVRPSTIEGFESHFGIKNIILPCYGLAEATLAVAIWPRGVPILFDPNGRFVSVGSPCTGVSVRIVTPRDDGAPVTVPAEPMLELPAGVEGEICVKSPGVMTGYYNDPAATAKVLSVDGWLRTGDLGFVDRDGHLFVSGRLKDLMIIGGENVIPGDIEELVDEVPGVRYSAAVAIDSERTGTQRLLVVAEVRDEHGAPTASHDLVRAIVARVHHARGVRPARVLLVRAGTIPKTSSGKIQRSRLAQVVQAGGLRDRLVPGESH
jgi:acyl-CoA synthetase (AMP-forming)/AMP-acid ligase II